MIRNYQRSGGGSVDLVPIYNSLNALQNEVNSLITITKLSTLTSISGEISGVDALSSSITALSTAFTFYTTLHYGNSRSFQSSVSSSFSSVSSSVSDLSSSITNLSTSFTYHVLVQQLNSKSFQSSVSSSFSSVSSSITNISSSVMDINSIVSSLSAEIGDLKTLTNPTESGYLFTDPVLYSGPDIDASWGRSFDNANNTYMKGVTWKDYPSTVTSLTVRTMPAYFGGCVIYGDFSLDNVYAASLLSNTVMNLIINGVSGISINNGSYNSISINKCNTMSLSEAYIHDFISPDCKRLSCTKCRMKDVSFDYPSTVTVNGTDYRIFMSSNTVDNINATVLSISGSRNDIWTANFYLDYDLLQNSVLAAGPISLGSNTINELSIFNNDHGTGNTTNMAIKRNEVILNGNSINKLWVDLLCQCDVSYNTIDTFKNIIGVSFNAYNNAIQELDCEVTPYSAYIHNTSTVATLAYIHDNTINELNLYHGVSDKSILNNAFLSGQITKALDSLLIYVIRNSGDYATFDVLNPLSVSYNNYVYSADINVANDMTVAVSDSIGTLNMVKNERFITTTLDVYIGAFSAHSVGVTNIYPRINAAGASINLLDMYIDDGLLESYTLDNVTIDNANIKYFATSSTNVNRMNIYSCSIDHLNYEQNSRRYLNLSSNTMNYCNIIGGGADCYKNRYRTMNIVVESAGLYDNSVSAFGGTCLQLTAQRNSLHVGAFYCSTATVSGGTVVRLNTIF